MNLDELCALLVEHGLIDKERFNPKFTERIMREGGVSVLQHQDADITANIKLFEGKIRDRIDYYSPEIVELYFNLQELANHVRVRFFDGVSEDSDGNGNGEKSWFTGQDRERLMARISGLEIGHYRSRDIGEPLGLVATTVGHFLARLNEYGRGSLRIRYIPGERKWERY